MLISSTTKIAALIGDPIDHSLSPKLHNYLLNQYQIDGIYLPLKVTAIDLALCLQALPKIGFKGCNVTIPHKEAAFKLCDYLSPIALASGAVNTIIIREGKLYGDNSDGSGFIANLKDNHSDFDFIGKKIVVLGAGGAARAICFALIQKNIRAISIINRSPGRSEALKEDFKKNTGLENFPITIFDWQNYKKSLEDCDLLINATSLGMDNMPEILIDISSLKKTALVADIVYKPLMTNFLQAAQERGNPILTGIGMLIHQALVGFEAWFGVRPQINRKLTDFLLTKNHI